MCARNNKRRSQIMQIQNMVKVGELAVVAVLAVVVAVTWQRDGGLHLDEVGWAEQGCSAPPVAWQGGVLCGDQEGQMVLRGLPELQVVRQAPAGVRAAEWRQVAVAGTNRAFGLDSHGRLQAWDGELKEVWQSALLEEVEGEEEGGGLVGETSLVAWASSGGGGALQGESEYSVVGCIRAERHGEAESEGERRLVAGGRGGRHRSDAHVLGELLAARRRRGAGLQCAGHEGGEGGRVWPSKERSLELEEGHELPWTLFAAQLLPLLPGRPYRGPREACLGLARLQRGAVRPSSSSSSLPANAAVVEHGAGLTVLHLHSGRPLTHVLLESHVLHVSLADDGLVYAVKTVGCVGEVRVGLPPQHAAAPVDLCEGLSPEQRETMAGRLVGPVAWGQTAVWLRGDGAVLCFGGPLRRLLWLTSSPAVFGDHEQKEEEEEEEEEGLLGPWLGPLSSSRLLVCGARHCALLSLSGRLLSSAPLPTALRHPPLVLSPSLLLLSGPRRSVLWTIAPRTPDRLLVYLIFAVLALAAAGIALLSASSTPPASARARE